MRRMIYKTSLFGAAPWAAGHRRRLMDRLAYAYIGSAAAEISVHGGVDLLIGRLRMFHEQRRGGHDLSSLAIPALRHVDFSARPAATGCEPSGESPSIVVMCALATADTGVTQER